MLARMLCFFQRRPKYKPLPPGDYVACVHKVSVHKETGNLHMQFVVPGHDGIFHAYLARTQEEQ